MAHIVKNEPWGIVDLDTERGAVFVRQDWHYKWVVADDMPEWTPAEELAFHKTVDRMVWKRWSHQVKIRVQRKPLAEPSKFDELIGRFSLATLSLSFDVRQVRGPGHWAVTVTKVKPVVGKKPRAEVKNAQGEILLFSTDQQLRVARRSEDDPKRYPGFSVPAHEFGHTIGNIDDYSSEEFLDDADSIMNVGHQLRPRHLALICETLSEMVPPYRFVPVILAHR